MPVDAWAEELRGALAAEVVPGRAAQEKRYLKSELEHLGVPLPAMRRLVKSFARTHRALGHDNLTALAQALWSRPVHEHRTVALLLLDGYGPLLGPADTALLERLLRECGSWAHVDLLAPFVAGGLLLRHPEVEADLRRWAAAEEQWVRRGGVLGFLLAIRRPETFPRWFPVFGEVADPLLEDERFFVRKAVGWVLREGSVHHPAEVAAWLRPRSDRVSRLTFREGTRRLPDAYRERLRAAWPQRRGTAP